MQLIPADRSQRLLLLLFLVLFAASCIRPPYPQFLLMQHVPTALATLLLAWAANRFVISRFSFAAIIFFLSLHTLGARYLYSYVPYDSWTEAILGLNLTDVCGFERNHYDRLVHFCYGLLLVVPIQEFECRYLKLPARWSAILAIECILATSALYELAEWLVAIVFAPAWVDAFLGQQGDGFDAQKDMALATLGAIFSMSLRALLNRCQVQSAADKRGES